MIMQKAVLVCLAACASAAPLVGLESGDWRELRATRAALERTTFHAADLPFSLVGASGQRLAVQEEDISGTPEEATARVNEIFEKHNGVRGQPRLFYRGVWVESPDGTWTDVLVRYRTLSTIDLKGSLAKGLARVLAGGGKLCVLLQRKVTFAGAPPTSRSAPPGPLRTA